MPSVSIIIPTYNRKDTVFETIDSALEQTFTDREIIVVDDGSSDGTKDLLYEKYGSSIKILRQDNQGPAAARNTGIRESQGNYLAFLDSDDIWLPETVETLIKEFSSEYKPGLVYCGILKIFKDDRTAIETIPEKKGMIYDQLLEGNFIGGSSNVLVKKDCLTNVGLFNGDCSPAEDYDLWLRIAKKYPVQYVPKTLVNYLVHPDGISQDLDKMEKAEKKILENHLSKSAESSSLSQKEINYFINYYARWSKIYLSQQNKSEFKRSFNSFLKLNPVNTFFFDDKDLETKEKLVFDSIKEYFNNNATSLEQQKQLRCKFYNAFAYKYYNNNNMRGFRKCFLRKTRNDSAVNLPRNMINYLKSFLGKDISESIHEYRKNFTE